MIRKGIAINKNNGNASPQDVIAKKVENVNITLQILENGRNAPNGMVTAI